MRPIISLALLLFSCLSSSAQSFVPVKDEAITRKEITEASQKITSIQCNFKQEKNLSMLVDKAASQGKFYFKKEGKIRLEYLQPKKNLLVMNNGKMLVADGKKSSQIDVHRNRIFRQLNDVILGSINSTLFSGSDFSSRFFENSTLVKVELTPLTNALKKFLSTIVLVLEKKDFTALRIEMNEPSGDNTVLTFSGKEINTQINDSLFAVR
ncbi:MAG: outer membrane lipoprotein carrier protein LolA [Bacteroidetes bacterium]|nr:outer membrane lipoprotein carrier protein LolA [Bacteroidota bacterium]